MNKKSKPRRRYTKQETAAYKKDQRELFWKLVSRPGGLRVRF